MRQTHDPQLVAYQQYLSKVGAPLDRHL
jgi:hypothetical protein